MRLALKRVRRQHQKSRRAESALQTVMINESLLQRMQAVPGCHAFDGADLFALRLDGKHQTRTDRFAINHHSAGAADAVLTTDMGSGLPAFIADGIDKGAARLHANGVITLIDGELYVDLLVHSRWLISSGRE